MRDPNPFIASIFLIFGTVSTAEVFDRTIAVVDKEVVLQSELDDAKVAPQDRKTYLDNLVTRKLLAKECKKLSIEPSAEEIQQAINDVKKQNHLDDAGLAVALKQMGMSLGDYKQQLNSEICKMKIVQTKIRPRVNISKEDIQQAYENEHGATAGKKISLSHIFIRPSSGSDADIAAAQKLADSIYKDLKGGAKWDSVLTASKSQVAKVTGEDLGAVARVDLLPQIADEAFAKDAGEIRGPIRTHLGFHVLRVKEQLDVEKIPLVNVEKDLHNQLYEKEIEKLLLQYIDDLRASAFIEVHSS